MTIPLHIKLSSVAANFIIATLLISFLSSSSFATERGEIVGVSSHSIPSWFKDSFLDIADDVEEASAENRHLMLFFHLNNCPYCDRMLSESFSTDPVKSYIQQHFDVIDINIRGDREVAFNEAIEVSEKALSEQLNVFATPAIIFLNKQNKAVVRIDGYRAPERFQQVLNYVSSKSYDKTTLNEYLDKNVKRNTYTLRDNPVFAKTTNLSTIKTPLLIIFEDGGCHDCSEFHDRVLAHKDVSAELKAYTVVRLDTDSDQEIIDTAGNKTTAKAMANALNMTYRPGIAIYNEGDLVRRFDSLLYSYHFKEGLRYISGGYYKTEEYRDYSHKRQEELLSAGTTINLAE